MILCCLRLLWALSVNSKTRVLQHGYHWWMFRQMCNREINHNLSICFDSKKFLFLFFLFCVFTVYFQALGFEFVSDDLFYLKENYLIRNPINIYEVINIPKDGLMGELSSGFFKSRNLRDVSYAIDYWVWGKNPSGFHFTNILLHLAAGFLLYSFGKLYLPRNAAIFAALVFLLHPMNSEVVAYISGRKESLMTIVFISGLLALEGAERRGKRWLYVLSLLLFVVSTFVKEAAIVFPAIVTLRYLLLGNSQGRKWFKIEGLKIKSFKVLMFLVAALLCLYFRMDIGRKIGESLVSAAARAQDLVSPLFLAPFYTIKFLIPVHFQFEYRGGFSPEWQCLEASHLLQLLIVVGIAAFIVFLLRKYRVYAFFVLWFFVALLPVLHFVPFHTPAAEHYLYLPSVGGSLALGAGFSFLVNRWPTPGISLLVLVAVFLASVTFWRVGFYENDYRLYSHEYANDPNNYNYYGMILGGVRSGDVELLNGIYAFEKLRLKNPLTASFNYTLGYMYEKYGDYSRARARYSYAIKYGKRPWEVYLALATLEARQGGVDEARRLLEELNRQYAYHPTSFEILGAISIVDGELEVAESHFKKARMIDMHAEVALAGSDLVRTLAGNVGEGALVDKYPHIFKRHLRGAKELGRAYLQYVARLPDPPGALEVL